MSIPSNVENKNWNENGGSFANPNEALPFNTKISETIKTKNQEPISFKYQSYPISMVEFVNKGLKELFKNGIVKPSRSPYNSPVSCLVCQQGRHRRIGQAQ